jgi:hypothetical protein
VRWFGLVRLFRLRRRSGSQAAEPVGLQDWGSGAVVSYWPAARPVTTPPTDSVPDPNLAPEPQTSARIPRVRLGFADGSEIELDQASGASNAIRATARRMLGESSEPAGPR